MGKCVNFTEIIDVKHNITLNSSVKSFDFLIISKRTIVFKVLDRWFHSANDSFVITSEKYTPWAGDVYKTQSSVFSTVQPWHGGAYL